MIKYYTKWKDMKKMNNKHRNRDKNGRFIKEKQNCRICGTKLNENNRGYNGNICKPCYNKMARIKYYKNRDRIRELCGDKCILCDNNGSMYHHIIPQTRQTNMYRYIKDAKSNNLVCMCKKCHEKWHMLKEEMGISIM